MEHIIQFIKNEAKKRLEKEFQKTRLLVHQNDILCRLAVATTGDFEELLNYRPGLSANTNIVSVETLLLGQYEKEITEKIVKKLEGVTL